MTVETHDRSMEIVEVRYVIELRPFDMIEEGVYVALVHHTLNETDQAEALPLTMRADHVPEVEQECVLFPSWDGENLRIITNDDMPMRVVRDGPPPPNRCDLPIEPCDQCPRRGVK